MTAGADQTFREVVRGAIGQGDTIRRWIEKSRRQGPGAGGAVRSLGVDPAMTLAEIENQHRQRSDLAVIGMAGRRRTSVRKAR